MTAPTPPADGAAISVRDVGKLYRIYAQPQDRLKQMLFSRLGRHYGQDFWALRHVSFDVQSGERFGVIGSNGSGKSTLLQLIAGTLAPTEGEVQVEGRTSALLELGSGFNPEFTGRENVHLNGAIQGLSPAQIDERFEQIAAFADIGEFIDQPVKLYSSGMFVRLAFAVSTSVDADVILIDEALAVGDVFFRQKCYRRLQTLRERNVAVVLVSHSMGDIEEFCDRTLLLDRGRAQFVGPSVEAVKRYYLVESRGRVALSQDESRPAPAAAAATSILAWPAGLSRRSVPDTDQVSDGWARCVAVGIADETGAECGVFTQGARCAVWSEYELAHDIATPIAGLVIHSEKGVIVHGKSTLEADTTVPEAVKAGERMRVKQEIVLDIAPGEYTFEVGLATLDRQVHARRQQLSHAEIAAAIVRVCAVPMAGQFHVVLRRPSGHVQLVHHGLANLPGDIHVRTVPDE